MSDAHIQMLTGWLLWLMTAPLSSFISISHVLEKIWRRREGWNMGWLSKTGKSLGWRCYGNTRGKTPSPRLQSLRRLLRRSSLTSLDYGRLTASGLSIARKVGKVFPSSDWFLGSSSFNYKNSKIRRRGSVMLLLSLVLSADRCCRRKDLINLL